MDQTQVLEEQLNRFDLRSRQAALDLLVKGNGHRGCAVDNVNMHGHTFFSYNALGWSPSRLVWEAHRRGFYALGKVEFDVLDGSAEFFAAAQRLGVRAHVGVETRSFVREFAGDVIDSPGEPGVSYIMGSGFADALPEGSPQAATLAGYRARADERNRALIGRINAQLPQLKVDYDKDVLPLTPSGNATERHIITAYLGKSAEKFSDEARDEFWARQFGLTREQAAQLWADRPAMEEKTRAHLAKRGGLGYEQPDEKTFPLAEDFFAWVSACGAIPMDSWVDGTSPGEARGLELLECMRAKGARAMNIIPERNWNIKDEQARRVRLENLERFIRMVDGLGMPVAIGTEMNRLGQPMVDDLEGEALRPYKDIFLRGANILVGHTTALRFTGFSYAGEAAQQEFGDDVTARNRWFESVGKLPAVNDELTAHLRELGSEKAFAAIADSAAAGQWKL